MTNCNRCDTTINAIGLHLAKADHVLCIECFEELGGNLLQFFELTEELEPQLKRLLDQEQWEHYQRQDAAFKVRCCITMANQGFIRRKDQ